MTGDIGQRGLCPLFGNLEIDNYLCDQALAIEGGGTLVSSKRKQKYNPISWRVGGYLSLI